MLLIVKERTKPMKSFFNEAILGRIPANHPQIPEIEIDNGRSEAGYIGEKKLDYFLDQLPEKDYYIFQGLRLPNGKSYFQIDALIFTLSYGLIIEAKNLKGELDFNKGHDQLIQKNYDKQKSHDDPCLQAQFQVRQLKELLRKHQFPTIPLEYLVLMSNPNSVILSAENSEARKRVCRGRRVVFKIEEFTSMYKEEQLDRDLIRKLSRFLIKKHTEPSYDIEKLYNIPRSELLTGVHCPQCRYLSMNYHQGSWLCPSCGVKSRDAHLQALKDYFLLFGPSITNQQFREFLHLSSGDIANKMLRKLKLPSTGLNKHRIYQLSWDK